MLKTIYSDEYSDLLSWLKSEREKANLTMREVASRLDVHHSWVGRVETGERRLDVMEFVRYCEGLGVDPHKGLDQLL